MAENEELKRLVNKYAATRSKINELDHEVSKLHGEASDCETQIQYSDCEHKGAVALYLTDHGFSRVIQRFEEAVWSDIGTYNDVYKRPAATSILTPSNFKSFVINTLSKAYIEDGYVYETHHQTGPQYRYTIRMSNLSDNGKDLEFTAIVKENKLITGFFRWMESNGD